MTSQIELPGYQLQNKFAEGGMASIYLGKQLSLGRAVAVKVLNQSLHDENSGVEEQIREAFESEAIIIARLNHPNIVQVIDRGISHAGAPYFVMEYIKGVSLAKAIDMDTLTLEQRYKLALQICYAIEYAHKNKVIHRDIKPDNILVDMQGNAKVLDFGIAVLTQTQNVKNTSNENDKKIIAGTARYMAPEVMSGDVAASVASDIFSLGFVLYELFSGLSPSSASVVQYRSLQEINPQLPSALDSIIKKCLHSRPELRPVSAQEVIQHLLEQSRGQHLAKEQRLRAQSSVGAKSFELLDVLSESENVSVYLFEEKNNHTQVLVKKYTGNVHGFIESKRLMGLKHKHIVPVLGASKNDRVFVVVMPYLPGGSLQDRLIRHLSLEEFVHMAKQICSAMVFAHQNGICHQHLSASSILFDESGNVQITDFSLNPVDAQDTQEPDNKPRLFSAEIDLRSAGLLFYHILTREPAVFKGGRIKTNACFMQLPRNLQDLVLGMLGAAHKPFNSFAEVQAALGAVTDSMPTILFQQQREGAPRSALGRHPLWVLAGILAAAGLLLAAYRFI